MIILYKVEIKDWGARDWGTPQIMSENVAWKGYNRQNLVFPTVFPRDFDTPRDLIYMLYLDWYDAKFSRKSGSFQKQCVFPLFSRQIKKELRFYLNSLIFCVDQPGLEPGTSRLWVILSPSSVVVSFQIHYLWGNATTKASNKTHISHRTLSNLLCSH